MQVHIVEYKCDHSFRLQRWLTSSPGRKSVLVLRQEDGNGHVHQYPTFRLWSCSLAQRVSSYNKWEVWIVEISSEDTTTARRKAGNITNNVFVFPAGCGNYQLHSYKALYTSFTLAKDGCTAAVAAVVVERTESTLSPLATFRPEWKVTTVQDTLEAFTVVQQYEITITLT